MSINYDELNLHGWCEIPVHLKNENELIDIANRIGKVLKHPNGNMIDIIKPKMKSEAIKNSFSYNYEYGVFPLHTDTAFWNIPARYVLLSNDKSSNTATTIVHTNEFIKLLSDKELQEIKKSIFVVKTQNANFYTKIINRNAQDFFFRFDLNCMKPVNSSAENIKEIFESKVSLFSMKKICWDDPKILVFDNWKTLHGRDAIGEDKNRKLKRIYIN